MTTDRAVGLAFACLLLVLPLSALIAQRIPIGRTIRMAGAWVAIFAIGLIVVSQRDRFEALTGLLDEQHVNGRMLVDSGATTTALSMATAKAAGIVLDERPFPVLLDTANGQVTARAATVHRLMVGSMDVTDLPVVVSPAFDNQDALGMNFLSRLGSWRVEGHTLVLDPKSR